MKRILFATALVLSSAFAAGEARAQSVAPMSVGINLAPVADWMTDARYANALNYFRLPGTQANPYTPDAGVTASENASGVPQAPFATFAELTDYPAGVYHLSYSGSATLQWSNATQSNVRTVNGITTADVTINPAVADTTGGIVLKVSGQNHFDNLKLMMPGTSATDTFNPAFVQKLSAFTGPIRVMDNHLTNTPQEVNWSDRTQPASPWRTYMNAGKDSAGVAWEDDISLANQMHRSLYLNIPATASQAYVQSLASLVKSKLDPSLTAYVTRGNEMQFSQSQMAIMDAKYKGDARITATDPYARLAEETYADAASAAQAFKAAGIKSAGVYEAFSPDDWYNRQALDWAKATYGASMGGVTRMALATYPGGPYTAPDVQKATNLDQLFTALMADVKTTEHTMLATGAATARAYGLTPTIYEAGQGILDTTLSDAAQNDPRMAQVYAAMLDDLKSLGYVDPNLYNFVMPNSQYGDWGLLTELNSDSVKYDAVKAWIAANGGVVVGSPAPVPEPSGFCLIVLAAGLAARRRH